MLNPKAIGQTTEAVIQAALMRRGDRIALPFGNNQRYDLSWTATAGSSKAQWKTRRLRKGVVRIIARSAARTEASQVDVCLGRCREVNQVSELPVDLSGTGTVNLRVRWARNGRKGYLRMTAEYVVEYVVPPVGFEPTAIEL